MIEQVDLSKRTLQVKTENGSQNYVNITLSGSFKRKNKHKYTWTQLTKNLRTIRYYVIIKSQILTKIELD